jgi:hypothetical protein
MLSGGVIGSEQVLHRASADAAMQRTAVSGAGGTVLIACCCGMVFGVWCRAFSVWLLVSGLWLLASRLRLAAFGFWLMAFGFWLNIFRLATSSGVARGCACGVCGGSLFCRWTFQGNALSDPKLRFRLKR